MGLAHSEALAVLSLVMTGPQEATFWYEGTSVIPHGVDAKCGERNGKKYVTINKSPCSAQRRPLRMRSRVPLPAATSTLGLWVGS